MDTFYIVFCIIIALCALLSPMLVAKENNRHQLELRKLDYDERHRAHSVKIVDGYFRAAGASLSIKSGDNLTNFGEYSNLIYFYLPAEYHEDISKLNNYIFAHYRGQEPIDLLQSISTQYAEQYRQRA